MSFVNKFNEIKLILIESLLEAFPRAEGDEIEAVVTHWLQSPTANIPFLTTSMRDKWAARITRDFQ
ncbi:MAG: hypothetical protein B7X28_00090 [Halothiobacillus sp. 13-55-253]|jgi:DNA (cytosine-5)-methyltransferase 1|nr:MAG: hypothetical protein B7X28_00090 [Halothiobacillus sp. 13-55-253]